MTFTRTWVGCKCICSTVIYIGCIIQYIIIDCLIKKFFALFIFRKTKVLTLYRRRIETIILTISMHLDNVENLPAATNPIFEDNGDLSYVNFREELLVLRSDD